MPKMIILRGNSGCGKSTAAEALQKKIGIGALLISQDYVRRQMLLVKDRPNNQAVDLLKNLVTYGYQNCEISILEGILYTDIYASLFKQIKDLYAGKIFAYYFDIPFEETLKRHHQRPIAHEFGQEEMRRWWRDRDFLPNICEKMINKDMCLENIVDLIYEDLTNN